MDAPLTHDSLPAALRQMILREMDDMCYPPRTDRAVHQLRLSGKRIRAWLRLLRDAMGEEAYRRENGTIRDLGRLVRRRRDSHVLIETLQKLGDDGAAEFDPADIAPLRRQLEDDAADAEAEAPLDEVLPKVREVLFQARRRIEALALEEGRPARTFRRAWTHARRAYDAARDHPDTETLHEWRKQAKYLRYQLEALSDIWPKRVKRWRKTLKAQADLLGQDHDLAVLGERVDDAARMDRITERRQALQAEVFDAARPFYRRKPAKVARHLARHWKKWRKAG